MKSDKNIDGSAAFFDKLNCDRADESDIEPGKSCSEGNLSKRRVTEYGKKLSLFLFCLFILSCVILRPLASGIAWGVVFAFLWHPIHKKLFTPQKISSYPNACAAVSLLLLVISFTIPLVFTIHAAFGELYSIYDLTSDYLLKLKGTSPGSWGAILPPKLTALLPSLFADKGRIADALISLAKSSAVFLRGLSGGLLQWTGALAFQGFIAVLTMFFIIRDGEFIVDFIRDLIPMVEEEREKFVIKTGAMMKSVAYGVILTVGIQALLGGLGWYFCGLSNSFLASAAMFIFGMFPAGTAVVWLPGALYLMATGSMVKGVALMVWGFVVVGMVDNVLRPIFIGGGGSIPTFAVILGLSGGIVVWGLLGVFLGPLVLAMFLGVLDLYRKDVSEL